MKYGEKIIGNKEVETRYWAKQKERLLNLDRIAKGHILIILAVV
jgi:hypothetical protein